MQCQFLDDGVASDRKVKPLKMVCDARAEISWYRIAGTAWTNADCRARIDEAVAWYNGYCIHLDFEALALDQTKPNEKRIQQDLDAAVAKYVARVAAIPRAKAAPAARLDDVQSSLLSIYDLIAKKVGRGRLVVIFLDEWYVLVGATANPSHWRTYRISANDGLRLLIGIDRYDIQSPHILTHELLHALRKQGTNNNKTQFDAFVRVNTVTDSRERVWQEHYGGANQDKAMSFVTRDKAFKPFAKQAGDVLTVREYLTILKAGYVKAAAGCTCDKSDGRERPRPDR